MDPASTKPPPMKDLNIDNITENTVIINSQGNDARLKYVMVSKTKEFLQTISLHSRNSISVMGNS